MKIQVISDMHLEFRDDNCDKLIKVLGIEKGQAEVGIMAGDLIPMIYAASAIRELTKLAGYYECLIYVPGNHDYYGKVLKEDVDILFNRLERDVPNLHILREGHEIVEHNGQRFIGSMMGYKYSSALREGWNMIADTGQIANIDWVFKHNINFEDFMWTNLKSSDIVITHHLPSNLSTPKIWQNSPSQPFFVHDMTPLIEGVQPKLWIHGHTHSHCDYKIGKTRVYCNPIGYPSERTGLDKPKNRSIIEV